MQDNYYTSMEAAKLIGRKLIELRESGQIRYIYKDKQKKLYNKEDVNKFAYEILL